MNLLRPTQASENSGTVDLRHFAFYAYAGRTGTLRWSRKNEVNPFLYLLHLLSLWRLFISPTSVLLFGVE